MELQSLPLEEHVVGKNGVVGESARKKWESAPKQLIESQKFKHRSQPVKLSHARSAKIQVIPLEDLS